MDPPQVSRTNTFDPVRTVSSPTIPLHKHQQILVDFINKSTNKGLIVFHSVGSGKTISSIMMAYSLNKKYPDKKIYVITPASLIGNYNKELDKTKINFGKNLKIQSYGTFLNKNQPSGNIIIVDEAHNFNALDSQRSKQLEKICEDAYKVIILTATPVKNRAEEIANLIKFISKDKDFKKYTFIKELNEILLLSDTDSSKQNKFSKLFNCKVSFFKNIDKTYYPDVKEHIVKFRMGITYYHKYYKIEYRILKDFPEGFDSTKDLLVFANGIRRATNKIEGESQKIDWACKKIIEDLSEDKKVLFYSSFKEMGINMLKKFLNKNKILYSEVHGSLSKKERDNQIKLYNTNVHKIMIVTAAGSEGLDLKETRTVILLEPYWNPARTEQVIGRAVRFMSHSGLPIQDRKVDVYHLVLQKPWLLPTLYKDFSLSADEALFTLSKGKEDNIIKFYDLLSKCSIERDSSCFK